MGIFFLFFFLYWFAMMMCRKGFLLSHHVSSFLLACRVMLAPICLPFAHRHAQTQLNRTSDLRYRNLIPTLYQNDIILFYYYIIL